LPGVGTWAWSDLPLILLARQIGKAVVADPLLADVGQLIPVLGALAARQSAALTAVMLLPATHVRVRPTASDESCCAARDATGEHKERGP
jgi:hypothetical protein